MARNIVIKGRHIYLNDLDISDFVSFFEVTDDETLQVTLKGSVSVLQDKKAAKPQKRKKAVKNGDR